jgi:hypothetical protein
VRVAFGAPLDVASLEQPAEIRTSLENAVRSLLAELCAPAADRAS